MKKVHCVMKKTAVDPPGPIVILVDKRSTARPTNARPNLSFCHLLRHGRLNADHHRHGADVHRYHGQRLARE